jgi:hypothetical protein
MAARVQRIEDLDRIPVAGVNWRPLRRTLGITAFGTNAYTADAGEEVVEAHDEAPDDESAPGHEEMYVVISGRARFEVAGEEFEAGPGTVVYLGEPGDRRHAVALQDGTTVLAVGGAPGTVTPSAWESWFAAEPSYEAGDYARAYEICATGLADHPEHPVIHYQLACYAARAGESDRAREHLDKALASGDPRIREWADSDDDLASVWTSGSA